MQRIKLDQDIRSLSEFRANVTSFIDEMKKTKRPLVITQHGKSSAVMIDVGEYEALLEKMDVLSDIQTAEDQLRDGMGLSHSNAKEKVLSGIER